MPTSRKTSVKRYTDLKFLKSLAEHCRKIRVQKGYSIDRMSKEGEQLSTSVIHRLESGDAPISILTLARYATVLNVAPKKLLDFSWEQESHDAAAIPILAVDDPRARAGAYKTFLPLYSLQAAAGYFGKGEAVEPKGWIRVNSMGTITAEMFIVQAVGKSMLPKISDGDLVIFRANPVGTRQGKIVLAQYRGPSDPETGGSYTIKKYSSVKIVSPNGDWKHKQITLSPLNRNFEPIILLPRAESDFRIIGEYVDTVRS